VIDRRAEIFIPSLAALFCSAVPIHQSEAGLEKRFLRSILKFRSNGSPIDIPTLCMVEFDELLILIREPITLLRRIHVLVGSVLGEGRKVKQEKIVRISYWTCLEWDDEKKRGGCGVAAESFFSAISASRFPHTYSSHQYNRSAHIC
jgi:hypothetical protein